MLFSSVFFLFAFLPVSLIAYYLIPKQYKNLLLLVLSFIFYSWGEPVYVLLLILSILINFFLGKKIGSAYTNKLRKRIYLFAAVALNLLLLGFFKYINFVIENINRISSLTIDLVSVQPLDLALPIGISFYTFQALSYIIDVYRDKVKVQNSLIDLALYISLFPQLIAGPIVRYIDVEKDLAKRKHKIKNIEAGIIRFTQGLGKKVLLANSMGYLADDIISKDVNDISTLIAWIGILAYTLQIYLDFSAYSDMAIGLGKVFGFKFPENFNYPYTSRSITDFWRRWHITLSTWFRDYVYIPLGGNRVSEWRIYSNIMAVFALTGIWHGASWNFIIWGVYYGILLVLEKRYNKYLEKIYLPVRILSTLLIVVVGWVFFRITSMTEAFRYLERMFIFTSESSYNLREFVDLEIAFFAVISIFISLGLHRIRLGHSGFTKIDLQLVRYSFVFVLLIISTAYLVSGTYNPFIYFRF